MTLEQYLIKVGKKPSGFAAELNVSPSTITRILNGERKPGVDLACAIEKATKGAVKVRSFVTAEAIPAVRKPRSQTQGA